MSLFHRHTIIPAKHLGVLYVDGAFRSIEEPGRHRVPRRCTGFIPVDMRDRLGTLSPQDVPTADGVGVRVTAVVHWRVADARTFLEVAEAPYDRVYLAVQLALRDALADVALDDVLRAARRDLREGLRTAARDAAREVGIEVADVVVKDVLMPSELRAAQADLVAAKARGLAQLEAARAETAALRSLANGAKLMDDHPSLARLRLVQALPPGARVELVTPES